MNNQMSLGWVEVQTFASFCIIYFNFDNIFVEAVMCRLKSCVTFRFSRLYFLWFYYMENCYKDVLKLCSCLKVSSFTQMFVFRKHMYMRFVLTCVVGLDCQ